MLDFVKMALRVTTDAFDDQLNILIEAAVADLGIAGVVNIDTTNDPLIKQAVATYCLLNFGIPDDAERIRRSYDEQKAQLSTHTGHTVWGVD